MSEEKEALKCLDCLRQEVKDKEAKVVMAYEEFLKLVQLEPQRVLRNVFQLFYGMVTSFMIEKEDEYPGDPESIGFVEYDCSRIFAIGKDNPFYLDRLLANRFVTQVRNLKQGSQQNRMYVYYGPPGCGKSTFLNDLLQTFEEYTDTEEGRSFEIFWDIIDDSEKDKEPKTVKVPCPSHDHPILIIPKKNRTEVLDKLLAGTKAEERHKFSHDKEYEWLFEAEACTICQSIFDALCRKFGDVDKVLSMVKVRPYRFNRRIGEGISVFNPGDKQPKEMFLSDKQIQEKLDQIFGVGRVRYIFSPLARTNNGIYVLMDVKKDTPNEGRMLELHNVISEGVHKVDSIEEHVASLLFALMNPEDQEVLKKQVSFEHRVEYCQISYVMEAPVEVEIFRSIFGREIDLYFLPRVLENFARVIISSRMSPDCGPLKEWITESRMRQYNQKHLCDASGLLLRMEIYGGIIPSWLSEEDKKRFTAPIRRSLIGEAVKEGIEGIDGRKSITLFRRFLNLYAPKSDGSKQNLITMANVVDFFKRRAEKEIRESYIPANFLDSLVDWYDFTVLGEVKEALYFYNRDQIREDILNFLWAVNYDPDGRKVECQYTSKEIEVTIEFFKLIGGRLTGESLDDRNALGYAQRVQKRYIDVLAREPDKDITETELYLDLFKAYARNLKEKVLEPFANNESFRQAVKSFGTKEFDTFEDRLKEHVSFMINNLISKFGYTQQGAKEVCLYVLDQNLTKKFS